MAYVIIVVWVSEVKEETAHDWYTHNFSHAIGLLMVGVPQHLSHAIWLE